MREIRNVQRGKWIAMKGCGEPGRIDTVWFRKTFCAAAGDKAGLLISACSRYKLYLNGEMIAYGPCKGGVGYQFFDRVSLDGMLNDGENELLAEVVSFPDLTNFHTDPTGGAPVVGGPDWAVHSVRYATLAVIEEDGSDLGLSTGDNEWTCRRVEAMEPVKNTTAFWLGYTERVDLAKGLRLEESAKLDWHETRVCAMINASAWGEVPAMPAYERPIPMMELGDETALTRPAGAEAAFEGGALEIGPHQTIEIELDAGEETTAFVFLRGEGGRGARVGIRYAEAYYEPDGSKNNRLPGGGRQMNGFADEFLPDGRAFEYSPYWFRTFRYIRLEIETQGEGLRLEAPGYRVTRYPIEAVSAVGEDREGWLAPLWEISLRSLRCCMHETFEDCPYYEQMQYTMDTRLQMLFAYRIAADTAMARRTLFDYHASRLPSGILQSRYPSNSEQVIPAFSLHWIFMLHDYYMQTGDLNEIRRYFGTMDGVLGYFRACRGEDGLVGSVGYWAFIDWVPAWERGVPAGDKGAEGSHNFLYAYALGVAASLARVLGYTGAAEQYEAEKAEILALAGAKFYDAQRGLYRYSDSDARFCQHTQVWAALAGVQDGAFRRSLIEKTLNDKTLLPCSFPMQYYLFRACEEAGLYERTQQLWDLWKTVLAQNLSTVPETPTDSRSDCHAWGALMLYEYPAKVLGVNPAAPGWQEISVKPAALYMGGAEGRACVPDGYVDVKWAVQDGVITLECTLETDRPVCAELPGAKVSGQGRGKKLCLQSRI